MAPGTYLGPTSVLDRLKQGLARTRSRLVRGFGRSTPTSDLDWERAEEALWEADLGPKAVSELLEAARRTSQDTREAVAEKLVDILERPRNNAGAGAPARPHVVLVMGVNGAGKTTTVARLAYRARQDGRAPLIVCADTFRAAAREQLETWARRLMIEIVTGEEGRDPAAVVHEGMQRAQSGRFDEIVIDTAGRLHTKRPLMDELVKVKRVASRVIPDAAHETLLVMDATVGGNGLNQAREFSESLGVDGIVLTKLDGTAKGGVAVAVASELGLPVRFVGVGEKEDDLLPFSPQDFVRALMED